MLHIIHHLPPNVIGLKAEGKVTPTDYETVLVPLLQEAKSRGRDVRLLYQISPRFSGFTAKVLRVDLKVGFKFFKQWKKISLVTDNKKIASRASIFGSLLPCAFEVFPQKHMAKAIEWLSSEEAGSNMSTEIIAKGVFLFRPKGHLKREDFDKLEFQLEKLQPKTVICQSKVFPGWENVGSFLHHLEFVKNHVSKLPRVALVTDAAFPKFIANTFGKYLRPQRFRLFAFNELDKAIEWGSEFSNEKIIENSNARV